jgi:hypothetical protein
MSVAVRMTRFASCAPVAFGNIWLAIATAPVTCGAAKEVPESVSYPPPTSVV